MSKLFALFRILRPGAVVANPALWKHGGAALQAALVPFLLALAGAVCTIFNVCLDISPEAAAGIAAGVVAIVGVFTTYATSAKVGLPGLDPVPPEVSPVDPAQDGVRGGP